MGRYIIIKLLKVKYKERLLKRSKKEDTGKETPIREWDEIFKAVGKTKQKKTKPPSRIYCLAKLP